jgi:hypothetical protein
VSQLLDLDPVRNRRVDGDRWCLRRSARSGAGAWRRCPRSGRGISYASPRRVADRKIIDFFDKLPLNAGATTKAASGETFQTGHGKVDQMVSF